MAQLQEESVEFARRHITRYYDTDFFPKHFAFAAIWHNWDDVKQFLLSRQIQAIPASPPKTLIWPKPRGMYRIVHQPDPISSLVYAALAHQVAESVERSREPADSNIACSYRISVDDGSFFARGTGYANFRTQTEKFCVEFSHILVTDITDFYNQIYVHRVRNAIATSDPGLERYAEETERLLMRLNNRTSQGIPVGPAASIIMSEAILTDVDRFIKDRGFAHTRYVDDFRIFSDSEHNLNKILRDLTVYLYEIHRLNLSGEKTRISHTEMFLKESLQNPYEMEKIDIFEEMEEVENPYTLEVEEVTTTRGSRDSAIQVLQSSLTRLLAMPYVDLGLARAVIRKARGLHLQELSLRILENARRLLPVINDLFLYLLEVESPHPSSMIIRALEQLCDEETGAEPAFRTWIECLIVSAPSFLNSRRLRAYVHDGDNHYAKARIAVIESNISWVREGRVKYWHLPPDDRQAVIFASGILSRDEREPWLRGILDPASGATGLERWCARTALDEAFDYKFASDDLDFFSDEIPF